MVYEAADTEQRPYRILSLILSTDTCVSSAPSPPPNPPPHPYNTFLLFCFVLFSSLIFVPALLFSVLLRYEWTTGNYGGCSKTCGTGTKVRKERQRETESEIPR